MFKKQKQRWSIRKTKIGAASVLLGMLFVIGGGAILYNQTSLSVKADGTVSDTDVDMTKSSEEELKKAREFSIKALDAVKENSKAFIEDEYADNLGEKQKALTKLDKVYNTAIKAIKEAKTIDDLNKTMFTAIVYMNKDESFAVTQIINQLQLLLDNKKSEIDKLSISSDDKKSLKAKVDAIFNLAAESIEAEEEANIKTILELAVKAGNDIYAVKARDVSLEGEDGIDKLRADAKKSVQKTANTKKQELQGNKDLNMEVRNKLITEIDKIVEETNKKIDQLTDEAEIEEAKNLAEDAINGIDKALAEKDAAIKEVAEVARKKKEAIDKDTSLSKEEKDVLKGEVDKLYAEAEKLIKGQSDVEGINSTKDLAKEDIEGLGKLDAEKILAIKELKKAAENE